MQIYFTVLIIVYESGRVPLGSASYFILWITYVITGLKPFLPQVLQ